MQTKMIVDAFLQIAWYAVTVLCWWIAAHHGTRIFLAWWETPAPANVHKLRPAEQKASAKS